MKELDLLIQNATIVEGTERKAYRGSIGIVGDRIAVLGQVKGDTRRVIEAEGLTALPGFVDAHSHADMTLLWYPRCESYVMQGVTTFVGGSCGGTMAPVGEYVLVPRDIVRNHLNRLDPYKYHPKKPYYPLEQVNEWMKELFGWTIDWKTMGGFFKKVEQVGISMNYASNVGHGTVRIKVMGLDYQRHTTDKELGEMRALIAEGMEEGCIGLSAGLDYDPGVQASQEEIIDCVSVIKKYGGVYCPHWRRTGRRRDVALGAVPNEKITALMECVDVYKKTGVRLHFAHLATGWDIYPTPPEELEEVNLKTTINMIMRESKGELDITWDAIPYLVRSTRREEMPYLCSLLEPWLRELGGREALSRLLKVTEFRDEVKEAIQRGKWYLRGAYNPNLNPKWAENLWVVKSKSPGLDGKSLAEIAKERGTDAWSTLFDVIAEDPYTIGAAQSHLGPRNCYDLYFTHPAGMVGLDTDVLDGSFEGKEPPYTIRGIGTYSSYPLFYIKLVRERKVLTLEQAVQKTATMPARVHNLKDRGVLRENAYADIVLIDMPNLQVLGTEVEPRTHPKGIEYVIVNGVPVVEKGKHTSARPGKVLRRT